MGSEPTATAPLLVEEALNRALAGDLHGGGMLLVPLIEDSPRECFALCAMLAVTCTHGLEREPDGMFALQVEDVLTGEPGRPEDLPPVAQFAAQFVTAWANEDQDAAQALFDALAADAGTDAGMGRVVDGVIALYGMAIASMRALIEEQRTNPNQREGNNR
ncbi:hypothetical protein [Streptomyces afghaniensis]|uniref:hypothetical protein n=1 Tax=Streptomyces afghaniensis TaxID=66865 RepID=UPI0027D7A618|nr:hypothetical protein [Streptomyces afghaniensis]